MTKYRHIMFLQDDDARFALDILNNEGLEAAIDYLSEWDTGDGDISGATWGSSDTVYRQGRHVLSCNRRLGYISLCYIVSGDGGAKREVAG
jgi:hypothetical protein